MYRTLTGLMRSSGSSTCAGAYAGSPGSASTKRAPPSSGDSTRTLPPCDSATWRTMARPRPGARAPARGGAAVEAIEDERDVLGGHAGAVVAHGDHAVGADGDLDAIGVLGGVVEQVVDRAPDAVGRGADHARPRRAA